MQVFRTLTAAGFIAAAAFAPATAADISGAGATFPYPIYAKWADAYKKETGDRPELSVDRLRRRHQADPEQDRDVRRHRRAAEGRPAREGRPRPVPDGHGRHRAGHQSRGHQAGRSRDRRPDAGQDLPRRDQDLERPRDREAQSERQAAVAGDRRRAPLRRLGHDLQLRLLSVRGQPRLEVEGRRQHLGRVAGRHRRQGQRRRRQQRRPRPRARSATSSTPTPSRTS